ncbi:hypothetical protein KR093_011295, partial [Drosophila rubida]
MDSRMLNVFHEDPFEGNFVKYDPEPNFWSANDDLQLTDTLNGILPIAPTDESLLSQKESDEQLQNSKNLLIYSDFVDQHLDDDANVLNGQVYRQITESEVEAVYEQQRQLSALIDSEDDDEDDDDVAGDDVRSQCSNSTFRTRTDSSSIGDYESHSSDYDDEVLDEAPVGDGRLLTAEMFGMQEERKNRTLSTNTIGSDADAFGLNIDVNNFDLADFITKDDFADNLSALRSKQAVKPVKTASPTVAAPVAVTLPTIAPAKVKATPAAAEKPITALPKPVIISSKSRDSDYDSDSIIDVETVDVVDADESLWVTKQQTEEAVAPADDLCYVDNMKADPSWSPKQPKQRVVSAEVSIKSWSPNTLKHVIHSSTATKPKASNNICLVPNKKQCDFLKRKVGAKAVGSVTTSSKSKTTAKKVQEANKTTAAAGKQLISTGLGLGGKNLALLKHERDAAVALASTMSAAVTPAKTTASAPAPKRKLNLEEYKQRKSGGGVAVQAATKQQTTMPAKQPKLEASKPQVASPTPVQKTQPSPQKIAISSIVNSLKSPLSQAAAPPTDPITVAKNKVLRMLELKRAQQLKIIDSRVSAKVPRVTKLPPLKDIVKDTYCMETEPEPDAGEIVASSSKLHADYEEIIIVSASCNTDITIPPHQASVALRDNKTTTPSSRSLLKSSVLLYNMSHSSEAGNKNMTNSLIASIQSEVVRQTNYVALAVAPAGGAETSTGTAIATQADKNAQHGEDKVIMHLAKNRVRKRMVSMGTQTDLQPEFPLLTLPTARQSRERTRRSYRKRRVTGSNGSSSSSSSSSSSIASYRSRSNSNSTERLRHSDATAACSVGSINGGGYSSRSTRRHRSSVSSSSYSESGKYERQQRQRQRRTSYNKRRSKNLTRDNCSTSGSEFSDRERSRSPLRRSRSRSPTVNNSNSSNNRRGYVDRNVSQPAVEERRIVYVGRIEQETTKEMLRRKFLPYGSIKQITIHYKENGMKYGFVTFERAQDAFTAIDTSPRDAQINMYDISFGGRRAFCRASYADLDNAGINNYHSYVFPKATPVAAPQEDSFEALLLKVKAKLNAGKPAATATDATPPSPASASVEGSSSS